MILGHDYTHNEVLKYIHLLILHKYGSTEAMNHSVREVVENERAEVRVDSTIKTDVVVKHDIPDIFIYDKKENEIIIIEVGITSQDNLKLVETEKNWKYDLLANELGLIYKAKTKIIPYVLTWGGIVTKYHKVISKS